MVVAVGSCGEKALVDVSDTGIGVPAAKQRRLFDRFFRASSALRRAPASAPSTAQVSA